jgi:soluble lytic murein transglycosylase-like protein
MHWWLNCRPSGWALFIASAVLPLSMLCYTPAVAAQAAAAQTAGANAGAPRIPADEAYRQSLAYASGKTDPKYLNDLYERIERAAYRYSIIPEFALSVVVAEARYGKGISFARYDSWQLYEVTTHTKMAHYPSVLSDLDTALSELRLIMSDSDKVEDVFKKYWCGSDGKFNADSLSVFSEAASKLWNGLEPYARARMQAEDRGKYSPKYYNKREDDDPAWAGLAYGDMDGYSSALGSMPALAKDLRYYGEYEKDYIRAARKYNKHLSEAEATVIVRAILTYCDKTNWFVDPRLVMALVVAESSFRPEAVSSCGAMGLGQLMPATARGFGIRDAFDPVQNLYGTVKYLERELYRWRGQPNQIDLVLAAYNAGPGAVKRYGGIPPYAQTQNYVRIVKKHYAGFKNGKKKGE